MSLIARHFEAAGLPTLVLGSALDILSAGKPPRTVFLNYPLGFESGRFQDADNQLTVVREALTAFPEFDRPGIRTLAHEWLEGWQMVDERERGKLDQRSERTTEPQYQNEADRIAAEGNAAS